MNKLNIQNFLEESKYIEKLYRTNVDSIESYLQWKLIKFPNTREYYYFLCDYYLFTTNFKKLREAGNFLISKNDVYWYYYLGCSYSYLEKYDKALKYLEKWFKKNSTNTIIWREYWFALWMTKDIRWLYILKRMNNIIDYIESHNKFMTEKEEKKSIVADLNSLLELEKQWYFNNK